MKKFKFTFPLANLFKRKEYDPTQFQTINDKWDETTSGNTINNISAEGRYKNSNLLLDEIEHIKQKLDLFDKSLPSLKK